MLQASIRQPRKASLPLLREQNDLEKSRTSRQNLEQILIESRSPAESRSPSHEPAAYQDKKEDIQHQSMDNSDINHRPAFNDYKTNSHMTSERCTAQRVHVGLSKAKNTRSSDAGRAHGRSASHENTEDGASAPPNDEGNNDRTPHQKHGPQNRRQEGEPP